MLMENEVQWEFLTSLNWVSPNALYCNHKWQVHTEQPVPELGWGWLLQAALRSHVLLYMKDRRAIALTAGWTNTFIEYMS